MAFDIVEKNKEIIFPSEWVDFPSGGRFKVNGILQPEFQRALEIFNQETNEEKENIDLISSDRIEKRNEKFAYAVGVFLVNDWEGIELKDGSKLEYNRKNIDSIFCRSAQKTELIDFVIREATRIQSKSLEQAKAILGKSQSSTSGQSSAQKKKRQSTAKSK